jgi:O-antigen ligase
MVSPGSDSELTLISACSRYLLFLLIASLGLPHIPIEIFGTELVITDMLFLLTAALLAVWIVFGRRRLVLDSSYWYLLAYFMALVLATIFSIDRSRSFERLPPETYLLLLPILVINILTGPSDVRATVYAWLAGSFVPIVLSLLAIALFYLQPANPLLDLLTYHYGSLPVGNYPRVTGGFVSASMLCNYLTVSFLFVVLAWQRAWMSARAVGTALFLILTALLFTISIGLGGIGLAVSVLVWKVSTIRPLFRHLLAAMGLIIALGFILVSPFALEPYPGAVAWSKLPFSGTDLMPSARALVWSESLQTFLAHPLTGVGLGVPAASVRFQNTEGSMSLLTDAHNSFLSVAAQEGLIGLAAFLAFTAVVLRRWLRKMKDRGSLNISSAAGLAFLCSFIYQGLTGSFEEARHLWVLIGVFIAADRAEDDQNS